MNVDRPMLEALDRRLSEIGSAKGPAGEPSKGWLQTVRRALGVSQREAAAGAGVSQQAFDQFEAGELKRTITLERFEKAAAALGCEVVYFLKPTASGADTFVGLAERRAQDPLRPRKRTEIRNDSVAVASEDLPVSLL